MRIVTRLPDFFPMRSSTAIFLGVSIGAVLLSGCGGRSSTLPVYDSNQVGQVIREQRGEIVAVRDVLIKAPSAPAGSTGAGSRIGAGTVVGIITGSPTAVAGAIGSVVGGSVGARADDRLGEEITIMVEGGQSVVIVQERDRNVAPLAIGERVKILTGSGSTSIYGGSTAKVVRDLQFATAY